VVADKEIMTAEIDQANEVGRVIRSSVWQVHEIFSELYEFFRLFHQGLGEANSNIYAVSSKGFLLPRDKATFRPADRFVKRDMGLLALIGSPQADQEDDDPEEIDEGDDDVADDSKAQVHIDPQFRFVGVRAVLIDPTEKQLDPSVVAAVVGSLSLTKKAGKGRSHVPQTAFDLRSNDL
jgi:hypothetical protein